MRTNLNEETSKRLLEIMHHYGYTSTNHTLNVIISSLYKSLFTPSLNEGNQHASTKGPNN